MILYNWMNQQGQPFIRRYRDLNDKILGRDVFEGLAERLPDGALELGDIIRNFDAIATGFWLCPRLFISHRMVDYGYAERIAWLASEHGWDYWLDVHDPGLAAINSRLLSPQSQALAVALIIEVALLNCTHVLATITENSPGSAWIPYEYGRVKPNLVASQLAACWLHPFHAITPAEYMNLGPILRDERAIRHWLSAEKAKFDDCLRSESEYNGDEWNPPDELPQ